jgi:2-polyprenyl-3-methyl-5-hydroxy-6-metoxy-1,4-benzoquinol methylase
MSYSCNLCGSDSYNKLFDLKDREIARCSDCGLISYHPIPSEKELEDIYNDPAYFDNSYFLDEEKIKSNHYMHFQNAAELASRELKEDGKILEIGPGTGRFIKMCKDRNLNIEAVEFSSQAAAELQEKFAVSVKTGDIEKAGLPENGYDMIVAFDVIEHCVDPTKWLNIINKALKDNGILVLSTISVKNLLDTVGRLMNSFGVSKAVEKLYPPYHLYYFTPDTLKRFLEKTNFELMIEVKENYDVRKASSSPIEQMILRSFYFVHNLTGDKTNQYLTARKKS